MEFYTTTSPLLFLIYNRPNVTLKVFNEIKKVKPARLYIAADGAKSDDDADQKKCNESRSIVDNIDWECEIKLLFRSENLGCKYAVSSAISWFFENEEKGIILEDDCLPNTDFFYFCDELLEKYKDEEKIKHISGANLQLGIQRGEYSYYFSNLSNVWGWATWRRAWDNYDVELSKFKSEDVVTCLTTVFDNKYVISRWKNIFDEVKSKQIDTWDYQWSLTNFFANGVAVIPNVNLIKNIGFGENATHTKGNINQFSNLEFHPIELINHPDKIRVNHQADLFLLNLEFNLKKMKRKAFINKIKFWK